MPCSPRGTPARRLDEVGQVIVAGFDEQAMDLRAVGVLDQGDLGRHPEEAAPEAALVGPPRFDLRLIGHRVCPRRERHRVRAAGAAMAPAARAVSVRVPPRAAARRRPAPPARRPARPGACAASPRSCGRAPSARARPPGARVRPRDGASAHRRRCGPARCASPDASSGPGPRGCRRRARPSPAPASADAGRRRAARTAPRPACPSRSPQPGRATQGASPAPGCRRRGDGRARRSGCS